MDVSVLDAVFVQTRFAGVQTQLWDQSEIADFPGAFLSIFGSRPRPRTIAPSFRQKETPHPVG
ncbi:hypothetical protein LN542_18970, partial [Xanthomonas hortorum pv. gardneri]